VRLQHALRERKSKSGNLAEGLKGLPNEGRKTKETPRCGGDEMKREKTEISCSPSETRLADHRKRRKKRSRRKQEKRAFQGPRDQQAERQNYSLRTQKREHHPYYGESATRQQAGDQTVGGPGDSSILKYYLNKDSPTFERGNRSKIRAQPRTGRWGENRDKGK